MVALDAAATGEDRRHMFRDFARPTTARVLALDDGTLGGLVVRAPWGGGATTSAPRIEDAETLLRARRVMAGAAKSVLAGLLARTRRESSAWWRPVGTRAGARRGSSGAIRSTGSRRRSGGNSTSRSGSREKARWPKRHAGARRRRDGAAGRRAASSVAPGSPDPHPNTGGPRPSTRPFLDRRHAGCSHARQRTRLPHRMTLRRRSRRHSPAWSNRSRRLPSRTS